VRYKKAVDRHPVDRHPMGRHPVERHPVELAAIETAERSNVCRMFQNEDMAECSYLTGPTLSE